MSFNNITSRVNRLIDRRIRAATIGVYSSVIKMTPVDSGRAKGNWQCTFANAASGEIERFGETGAISEIVPTVRTGGVMFFTNNLPYIQKLEYGA